MPPKMMVSSPRASPLWLILFPYVSSIAPACFWLVVEWKTSISGRLKPQRILVFDFLLLLNSPPRAKRQHAPTLHTLRPGNASSPTSTVMWKPSYIWLLCVSLKRWPPKAKAHHPSLLFDGLCLGAPNKGKKSGEHKPDGSRSTHTHRRGTVPRSGGTSAIPMEWEG